MKNCNWQERVEHWFDGESPESEIIEAHVADCATCRAHVSDLELLRTAASANAPEIADAQFNAFMDGVREGMAPQPSRWRGLWTMASLTAAAFVVAFSAFILMRGTPKPVLATEIESVSTELDGATVDWSASEDVMTVWVNLAEDDLP